jgi:hypothetical protein
MIKDQKTDEGTENPLYNNILYHQINQRRTMPDHDPLELEKIHAIISNLNAETAKFVAEGEKYRKESRWLPVIWATAFVAAVQILVKFLH